MLSAAEWCFYREGADPLETFTRLRDGGYTAVEMVPPGRRAVARKAGLALLNFAAPGMTQGLNHIENQAALMPQIRDVISQSSDDGIPQVIVFSGNRAGLPHEEGIAATAHALRELAPFAQEKHVTLTLEVLNPFDHADYHASFSKFAFDVVTRVAHPNVKVLYDLYHMHRVGEDVTPTIVAHLPLIAHLHLAASPTRRFPSEPLPPDHRRAVREILAAGYEGHFGMEFVVPAGSDPIEEYVAAAELFRRYGPGSL